VPKPNYGFQKRQKELAKQQKREAKAQRRLERADSPDTPPTDSSITPVEEQADSA
jgi:hypothetical protein